MSRMRNCEHLVTAKLDCAGFMGAYVACVRGDNALIRAEDGVYDGSVHLCTAGKEEDFGIRAITCGAYLVFGGFADRICAVTRHGESGCLGHAVEDGWEGGAGVVGGEVEFGIHKFLLYAYYTSSVPSKEIFDSVESYLRKKISGNVEKVRSGRLNIKKYDAFDVIVQIVRGSKLIIGVEVMGDADEPTDEGFPGTEIGLPLDRENCESTDASGISTPTGTVGSGKKISVDSDRHIICPECKSDNVNIHNNGTIFHCVDCGNEWPTSDSDNNGIEDDEESRDHFIDRDDKKLVKEDTTRKVVEACISESYIEDRDGNKLDSITLHSTEWCWFYSDNGIKYTIHCVRGKMKVFKDGTREVKPTKDMKSKVKVEV